ncbi:MAG: hypothetical protein ABIN95_03155 [Mucilaginibacter sp.]
MKKIFLLLALSLTIVSAHAQTVEAMYVTYKNDTVRTRVLYRTFKFYPDLIDAGSFKGTIKLLTDSGITKVKEKDIKYMELYFTDKNRVFTTKALVPELNHPNQFYEIMATGKITWYRSYQPGTYSVDEIEHFLISGQPLRTVSIFGRLRKALREMMGPARPDLIPFINDMKTAMIKTKLKSLTELLAAYNKDLPPPVPD